MEELTGTVDYGNRAVFAAVPGMTRILLVIPNASSHVAEWVTAAFDRYNDSGVPEGATTRVAGRHESIAGRPIFAIAQINEPPI